MARNAHLSLAQAQPGQLLEVHEILFGIVRDRCSEAGIEPGSVLTCIENGSNGVTVLLADGRSRVLEWHYAWFVSTTPFIGLGIRWDEATMYSNS